METKKAKTETACTACGMYSATPREYHPWAVCELFKATRNSNSVRVNIKAVIEYGMKAQKAGISAEDAMADFNAPDKDQP
jgi:hypothetical protein